LRARASGDEIRDHLGRNVVPEGFPLVESAGIPTLSDVECMLRDGLPGSRPPISGRLAGGGDHCGDENQRLRVETLSGDDCRVCPHRMRNEHDLIEARGRRDNGIGILIDPRRFIRRR
jgi:hypothetical protein